MDIVGYTYSGDNYCPRCITAMFAMAPTATAQAETTLDVVAAWRRIDRYDENTFDSGAFPKVIFRLSIQDDETCGNCHERIR